MHPEWYEYRLTYYKTVRWTWVTDSQAFCTKYVCSDFNATTVAYSLKRNVKIEYYIISDATERLQPLFYVEADYDRVGRGVGRERVPFFNYPPLNEQSDDTQQTHYNK